MEKRKHESAQSEYPYNFVAPYDLENCCRKLAQIGQKNVWGDNSNKDSTISAEFVMQDNAIYSFTLKQTFNDKNKFPTFIAGQLRYWTADKTLVSFRPEIDVPTLYLLAIFIFGCGAVAALASAIREGDAGGVAFFVFYFSLVLPALILSYLSMKRRAVTLVQNTFNLSPKALYQEDKYLYFEEEI